jgi:hypothetical protein
MLGRRISPGLDGAGEIGHIVVKLNGARCLCGRRGGMEAYAGRGALERRARRRHAKGAETELLKIMKKRDRPRTTSGIWAKALKRDDRLACKLIAKAVEALCAGVASASPMPTRSPRRCCRTFSTITGRRLCWSPRSATSPERSVPACSHPPLRGPRGSFSAQDRSIYDAASSTVEKHEPPRGRVTPGCCAYRPSARRH